jgi:hypothetical protein
MLLLAVLLSCAHAPGAGAGGGGEGAAIREGDSLAEVRRKVGEDASVRAISPTEKVLSALYPSPCPDVPAGPADLSRPACGTLRLLTIRLHEDRVVSVEWGDPPEKVTAPAEP